MKDYFAEEIEANQENKPRDYFAEEIGENKMSSSPQFKEAERETIQPKKDVAVETAKSFGQSIPILPGGQSVSSIKRGFDIAKDVGQNVLPVAEKVGMELFERPSATSRSAIKEDPRLAMVGPLAGLVATSGLAGKKVKEAAMRGVVAPREIKTFQQEAIDKFTPQTRSVLINFVGGLPANIGGLATDIATSPTEVLMSVLPTTQAGKAITQGQVASKLKTFVNKPITFRAGEKVFLNRAIESPLTKSISPSIKGKKTFPKIKEFKEKAIEAVSTIHDNIDGLQLTDSKTGKLVSRAPESLNELSQAIYQTKRAIYSQIDEGLKVAGKKGLDIDTGDITDELLSIAYDKKMDVIDPSVRKYALQQAETIKNLGKLSIDDTENIIQKLNFVLDTYYKNPTVDSATKVNVNAMVANRLRVSLDKAVSEATGKSFQPLKNKYGALKTIEADVARRALHDSKKAPVGLISFPDIMSAGDVARGITSQNPSLVTKGGFQLGMNAINKMRNDPNRMVKNMFKTMDKIKTRQALKHTNYDIPARGAIVATGANVRRKNENS